MNDRVTVVIPTYRRGDLLAKCVDSVLMQAGGAPTIVIVDDSGDRAFGEEIEAICPKALVVHHESNRGFAVAANRGIREAQTEWVMLLNDDMVLARNCIEELCRVMQHGNLAGVGPLILDETGDHIYAAGDRLLRNGRPESIGHRVKRDGFTSEETPFGITAGAALYSSAFLEDAGGFDEEFGAYFEDADLCARGRLWGRFFVVHAEAVAYHVGSASIEGRLWWRTRQCMRNHLLLVKVNFPLTTALKFFPSIFAEVVHHARRTFGAVRGERGAVAGVLEVLRVYGEVFTLIPHVLRKRWWVQRQRKISAREFEVLLSRGGR